MDEGGEVLDRHAVGQSLGHHGDRKQGLGGYISGIQQSDLAGDVAYLDLVAEAFGHEPDVGGTFLGGDLHGLEALGNLRVRADDA